MTTLAELRGPWPAYEVLLRRAQCAIACGDVESWYIQGVIEAITPGATPLQRKMGYAALRDLAMHGIDLRSERYDSTMPVGSLIDEQA